MNLLLLKSAIVAAKKKNNLSEEIIFLVGDEDQVQTQPAVTNCAKTSRKTTTAEAQVPVRAKVEKTPSFKETLSRIDSIGKEDGETKEVDQQGGSSNTTNQEQNSFDQSELDDSWTVFVERLRKKDVRMYSALKSIQPLVADNHKVEISFQNNAQLEEFQGRVKPLLTSELRESLKNEYIEIIEKVVDTENLARPKLLNDKEKLERMIEKNPALLQLKNKFKLDFE